MRALRRRRERARRAPAARAGAGRRGGAKLPDLEPELDELFTAPLEEFTARRTALARRLRQEGRGDDAASLAAQRKPTLPAWLATQLVRRSADAVQRLLEAGGQLVEAQRRALEGGGPELLQQAMGAERDAVQELISAARQIPDGSGRPASGAMLDRLAETLRAAAVDPEGQEELARGRVTREYERSGFDALGLFGPPAAAPAAPAQAGRDDLAERRRLKQEQERRLRELRAKVKELSRAAAAAERGAERAEEEADRLRAQADERRAEVDAAEAELEEAEEEASRRSRR